MREARRGRTANQGAKEASSLVGGHNVLADDGELGGSLLAEVELRLEGSEADGSSCGVA